MSDTLPDIALDGQTHMLFAAGFWLVLIALVLVLAGIMIVNHRAKTAGIHRKYVMSGDSRPHRHRAHDRC